MPHQRKRHLTTLIKKSLTFSPIVGIFGHRQVGKTTLCEFIGDRYTSLDRSDELNLAMHSPESFLSDNRSNPLVIDECQMAPPLFPALKEWVRTHKAPGQFLVSGSVRFSSRKAIRESLTGRIINWELLPMDLAESHSSELPNTIPHLLDNRSFRGSMKPAPYFSKAVFEKALNQGGLPGVFSIRDSIIRKQKFETQIETLLERDLRLLVQTNIEYRTLRNLLSILALRQGLPLDLSEISRAARISIPALRRLLAALESMFVIRVIETEGSRKKPVLYFEDQGEATHLAGESRDVLFNMTRFIFSFVRQQWTYRPQLEARLFQFRSRGGAFVPLALRSACGILGLIPMLDDSPGKHELASAQSFCTQYQNSRCIFIHMGEKNKIISDALRIVPLRDLV